MVGTIVQRRRERLDLTRAEFAIRAGMTRSAVHALEVSTSAPTLTTLSKAAEALGCKVWQLLKEADL